MKRLIELRAERNLTQVQVAQRAGVSSMTIHKMEHGQAVNREAAAKVLKVLGVSADEVAGLVFSKPVQERVNRRFVPWARKEA